MNLARARRIVSAQIRHRAVVASTLGRALRPGDRRPPRPGDRLDATASMIDPEVGRPVDLPAIRAGRRTIDLDELRRLDASTIDRLRLFRTVEVPGAALTDPPAAAMLATIAAAGVSVRLSGGTPGDAVLGPRTVSALSGADGIADRELHSVGLRRAALLEHGPWAQPSVSVLLASRRPEHVLDAIEQIARQRDVRVQLVVGLHGDAWTDALERAVRERAVDLDVTISRHHPEQTLGAVLGALTSRADGDLVSKWDDDDWYGDDHLADVALAHRFSGADVTGKLAEFVHVQDSSVTIRRSPAGAEAYRSTVAGGTMCTTTAWIDEVGGWPDVPRHVDLRLLDATRDHGGTVYRTHGYQYVLRRQSGAGGHTWSAPDAYFLDQAVARHPGLALAAADIRNAGASS